MTPALCHTPLQRAPGLRQVQPAVVRAVEGATNPAACTLLMQHPHTAPEPAHAALQPCSHLESGRLLPGPLPQAPRPCQKLHTCWGRTRDCHFPARHPARGRSKPAPKPHYPKPSTPSQSALHRNSTHRQHTRRHTHVLHSGWAAQAAPSWWPTQDNGSPTGAHTPTHGPLGRQVHPTHTLTPSTQQGLHGVPSPHGATP
jgi:hypothetical protein